MRILRPAYDVSMARRNPLFLAFLSCAFAASPELGMTAEGREAVRRAIDKGTAKKH